MLNLYGFLADHETEIRACFDRLTADWPGGWEREVWIRREANRIIIDITGWSHPKVLEPYTNDLLAFMGQYWQKEGTPDHA